LKKRRQKLAIAAINNKKVVGEWWKIVKVNLYRVQELAEYMEALSTNEAPGEGF
jgi:hypothetical protein